MSNDPTSELLAAFLTSSPERKATALKVLKGESSGTEAKPVTGPLLFGVCDAAKFLGVSRATLWRAIQAGRISKVQLYPGSFRVRRADLEDLAAGRPVQGGERLDHGGAVGTAARVGRRPKA